MDEDVTIPADDSAEDTEQLSEEEKSALEKKAPETELTDEQKKEKEQEEQDRRSRLGQVKKQFQMLATEDDYTLEDVPERLREEVVAYQKEVSEKIQPKEVEDKVNVEDIVKKQIADAKETDLLEVELNKLGEKEATEAEETYEDLKTHGYNAKDARIKTIALHSIPSDSEYTAHAGRSHKVGGNARTQVKTREDETETIATEGLPKEFQA